MHVEWYGQSAFRLDDGETTVAIDPFGDMSGASVEWGYPAISVDADVLLVTHEHRDHNGVDAVGGSPVVVRSTAGRHESPIGDVVGVASEHDAVAGTERGPNTMFVFDFGGLRVAHLGDLGQTALRDEQAAAIGTVDLLFVPVGGGPTIGAAAALDVAERLGARIVVPMHYRTERIGFLEPVDDFLAGASRFVRLERPSFEVDALPEGAGPLVVVPAAP